MESIILFAPLIGALLCGFGWRIMGETAAQSVSTALLFVACVLSWIVFLGFDGETRFTHILPWIESGSLATDWSIRLDRLTAIMLVVITTVSALVHLYSFGYMAHDENFDEATESYRPRFFAYLSFFTFAMLTLVTADNLVQMFFGWEGVGLASYLLIGFYFRKPSANAAAIKAFIVNRVGDFGFALGIFALFFMVDSISLTDIFAAAPDLAEREVTFLWTTWPAIELVCLLLFVGAMGKSAQFILHTWLPDAMEGANPGLRVDSRRDDGYGRRFPCLPHVSADGVCRLDAELHRLYRRDHSVLRSDRGSRSERYQARGSPTRPARSSATCSSRPGSAYTASRCFHLFTARLFKGMLFLGAGSVITGMHHEQDMRNYGGLRTRMPYTFWSMMIGTLAITGVGIPLTGIGFAGFLSKDAVIESAFAGGTDAATFAFWALVVAAAFTSFYSWRLLFMTFFGEPRGDKHAHEHVHESPASMVVPLAALAVGAVFAGMVWYKPFFGSEQKVQEWFGIANGEKHAQVLMIGAARAAEEQNDANGEVPGSGAAAMPGQGAIYMAPDNSVLHDAHYVPAWGEAFALHRDADRVRPGILCSMSAGPTCPRNSPRIRHPLYRFLLNKWYFDELYEHALVRPAKAIGRFLWQRGDLGAIDGFLNGVAMGVVPFFTRLAGRAQSGYIFTYAFWMVLGILVFITWMTIAGGQ